MRRLLAALLATVSLAGVSAYTASAADLPRAAPAYKAPIYAPVYNWTGFYIGGNVGYGWSNGDGNLTFGGATVPVSGSGSGVFGGAQFGYNWQAGSIVFGLETDIQASSGSSSGTTAVGGAVISSTAKSPWFGTIRGRLGYAFDRTLLYVTGGGVYGESKLTGTISTTGAFSTSTDYWSWTVGGGIEQALADRWTVKLEYLYVGSPNDAPVPPGTQALSGDSRTHLIRTGLNYRF